MMMRYLILFSCCLWQSVQINAQYAIIQADAIAYYEQDGYGFMPSTVCSTNCLLPYAFDSIQVNGLDTTFFQIRYFNELEYTTSGTMSCLNTQDTTWAGLKTVKQTDETHLFFNQFGDTINIKPQATLNEAWRLYTFPNGDYLEATVQAIDLMDIQEQSDSVKIIVLQAKDTVGNTISHVWNQRELLISQRYGFVKTIHFQSFPMDTTMFHLVRIDGRLGLQNFDAVETFDYNIGDEFHYEDAKHYPQFSIQYTYSQLIVLDKQVYPDSFVYQYHRRQVVITPIDTTEMIDTLTETIVFQDYKILNGATMQLDTFRGGYTVLTYNDGLAVLEKYANTAFHSHQGTDCWDYIIDGLLWGAFYKGLGGPYGNWTQFFPNWHFLIYYQKGNKTGGTPLNFDALTSTPFTLNPPPNVKVFPNPATDQLTLEVKANKEMTIDNILIYNQLGQIMWKQQDEFETIPKIDIAFLPKGLYFIVLQIENQRIIRKFIKR